MLTSYQQSHIDYVSAKYGNSQGFCGQIAEEIQAITGGEITAGYLILEGYHRREHWWVTLPNNQIIDPMADSFKSKYSSVEHEEIHRDLSLKYW
jgi:hypothetical protein